MHIELKIVLKYHIKQDPEKLNHHLCIPFNQDHNLQLLVWE